MARKQTTVAEALEATQSRAGKKTNADGEATGVRVEDVIGEVKNQTPVKGVTGVFKSYDNRRRPRKLGKRHLSEVRMRSVKDGGIYAFVMDDHSKDGQPNQATQQILNNLKLKCVAAPLEDGSLRMVTKRIINDETEEFEEVEVPMTVPTYFFDESTSMLAIPNGQGFDVAVPMATPEILRTMQYNLAERLARREESLQALQGELDKPGPTFSEKAMG